MASPNARLTSWDATWNSVSLGLVNKVNPDLKIVKKPIKRGTTGGHVLGKFYITLEGQVSVECPAATLATMKSMTPWYASGTQILFFPPTLNAVDYSNAHQLVLHPHDKAADLSEDMIFLKAVPASALNMERDGDNEEVWKVMFDFYPDFDQLTASPPVVAFGYMGI
jgi:hypothetical protein